MRAAPLAWHEALAMGKPAVHAVALPLGEFPICDVVVAPWYMFGMPRVSAVQSVQAVHHQASRGSLYLYAVELLFQCLQAYVYTITFLPCEDLVLGCILTGSAEGLWIATAGTAVT